MPAVGPATVAAWMAHARELEPASVDGVSYGLPTLLDHGKPLVTVAQTAAGYSVYPFSGGVVAAVAITPDGEVLAEHLTDPNKGYQAKT